MTHPAWFVPPDAQYYRDYRRRLGFANQAGAKNFFKASDINPDLDWGYIRKLTDRLKEIVDRLQGALPINVREEDPRAFKIAHIDVALDQIERNGLLPRLNNQGRRPEEVYFSWMRGHVTAQYFKRALSVLFSVDQASIADIGQDDLSSPETFRRAPTADLRLPRRDGRIQRIEMQSGYSGINDIKQHKVLEAKRRFAETGDRTMAIHFDLFNGQVAFVPLEAIEENSTHWITRQQMEGRTVFNIDGNYFLWRILDQPRTIEEYESLSPL